MNSCKIINPVRLNCKGQALLVSVTWMHFSLLWYCETFLHFLFSLKLVLRFWSTYNPTIEFSLEVFIFLLFTLFDCTSLNFLQEFCFGWIWSKTHFRDMFFQCLIITVVPGEYFHSLSCEGKSAGLLSW